MYRMFLSCNHVETFARLLKSKQNCLWCSSQGVGFLTHLVYDSIHGLIWRVSRHCNKEPDTSISASHCLVGCIRACDSPDFVLDHLIPECLGVRYLLQQHLHTFFSLLLKELSFFGNISSLVTHFILIHPKRIIQDVFVSCSGLQLFKIALWVCFGFWGFFFPSCCFDPVNPLISNSPFPQLDLCSCSPYTYLRAITCFSGVLSIITFPREKHTKDIRSYFDMCSLLSLAVLSVQMRVGNAVLHKCILIWYQLHLLLWVVPLCGLSSSLETWLAEGIINTINVLSTVLSHSLLTLP